MTKINKQMSGVHKEQMGKIIDDIIVQLKQKTLPWRKPWGEGTTYVIIGGMRYSANMWPSNVRAPTLPFGVNNGLQMLLKAKVKGYKTNLWITKKAIAEVGAEVDHNQEHHYFVGGYNTSYTYYNIEQINDYEAALGISYQDKIIENKTNRYIKSTKHIGYLEKNKNLRIVENRQKACYFPTEDIIHMPNIQHEAQRHATLWHEIIHWTGHKSRLNRLESTKFGDDKYAFEELVAELGAAFICSRYDINDDCQFASYIDSWIDNFKTHGYKVLHHAGEYAQLASQYALSSEKPTPPTNDSTLL